MIKEEKAFVMKHQIGYACINITLDAPTNKTCRLINATESRLRELIEINLAGLLTILKWNKENNITLFRISSDIIPFASHPINKIDWAKDYKDELLKISNFIKENKMRVSMHPGQYVNINSPNITVVNSSLKELFWHNHFLDALKLDSTHRIILHVGGVYSNKPLSMQNFIKAYKLLPQNLKARLSLENDDKSYTVWDILNINKETGIPLIFDNLHHSINNSATKEDQDIENILKLFFSTWNQKTGRPKIHYSTQKEGGKRGSHANEINQEEFADFYLKYNHLDFDIMFETKNKEKSVLAAYEMFKTDQRFKHIR